MKLDFDFDSELIVPDIGGPSLEELVDSLLSRIPEGLDEWIEKEAAKLPQAIADLEKMCK